MEASAITKMVEDAFYNHFFIIDAIISDDDSTIRAITRPVGSVMLQKI